MIFYICSSLHATNKHVSLLSASPDQLRRIYHVAADLCCFPLWQHAGLTGVDRCGANDQTEWLHFQDRSQRKMRKFGNCWGSVIDGPWLLKGKLLVERDEDDQDEVQSRGTVKWPADNELNCFVGNLSFICFGSTAWSYSTSAAGFWVLST